MKIRMKYGFIYYPLPANVLPTRDCREKKVMIVLKPD